MAIASGDEPINTVDGCMEALKKLNNEAHHYHHFIAELQAIARLVEGQRFSLKGIRQIPNNKVVKGAIKNLEQTFHKQLTEGAI